MARKICKRCGKERNMFRWEELCYSCRLEKDKDDKVERIKNGERDVDTGSSKYVICPYCGDATETCWGYEDYPQLYEEGDHEIQCEECGKTFILESSCSWYYETRKVKD